VSIGRKVYLGLINIKKHIMTRYLFKYLFLAIIILFSGCAAFRPVDPDVVEKVTDIDGNSYETVTIGEQEWFAENLRVTRYRNGDSINGSLPENEWYSAEEGAYFRYDDDKGSDKIYGKLYNWYAVIDQRSLCPEGWTVPADSDWKQLEIYLGLDPEDADEYGARGTDEGGKLKIKGTTYWTSPNDGATNESGFTALPGGYVGGFYFIGLFGSWWTTTEIHELNAWSRLLDHYTAKIYRLSNDKKEGFSVRCIREQTNID